MSIRTRVILLSLFSLLFLSLAILSEYIHVRDDVLSSQKSLYVVEEVSAISQLIHSLQKERGLTSMYLMSRNKTFFYKLFKQREVTDKKLKNIPDYFIVRNKNYLARFANEIREIRHSVDSVSGDGKTCNIVKKFYTLEIDKLLIDISLEFTKLRHEKEVSHQLYAILYFLKARENLGLIRADILCYYKKSRLTQVEILDSSFKYGIFVENLKYFKIHIKKTSYKGFEKYEDSDFLNLVKLQMKSIIKQRRLLQDIAPIRWWKDVTSAIDIMKETEDAIFKRIKESSHRSIDENKERVYLYIVIAFIALTLISLLTVLVVLRILQAPSELIRSLNEVEDTQNFSLRLCTKSKDEFGKLCVSFNKLLAYTDQILQEKDRLASTDLLTGVMNRRSFVEIAKREIEHSSRYDRALSLIFCDIDNFKRVNDTYGHNVGDNVLKSFSSAISQHIRKSDYLVRWGGEEFLILATETNALQASELAEILRSIISKLPMDEVGTITCSFGVAEVKKGESLEELHKRADDVMYKAKAKGRNLVCVAP